MYQLLPKRHILFFVLLLSLCRSSVLMAQCERVGRVESILPNCGAVVLDLDSGKRLRLVSGYGQLSGGQTFSFSSAAALPASACPNDGLPPVAFTCFSPTLPTQAYFAYGTDADGSKVYWFEADVYDENLQRCSWDFGDGNTAKGKNIVHRFAKNGDYNVCLSVEDKAGNTLKQCRKVSVGGKGLHCGFDMEVTAVGTQIYAKVLKLPGATGELTAVRWLIGGKIQTHTNAPSAVFNLPAFGTFSVCAQVDVTLASGAGKCSSTLCKQLTVSDFNCYNPILANPDAECKNVPARVCGCDGITYENECEAMAAGIDAWNEGDCEQQSGACLADFTYKMLSGNPQTGYQYRFKNTSNPGFLLAQIDFGDGSPIWHGILLDSVVEHRYAKGGIYRANLTVWNTGKCVSSATKLIITDALSLSDSPKPAYADYVYPGDANGDRKANAYDILNLGIGYDQAGIPRPNAHTNWIPQFAPDWEKKVGGIVDFKHLDCNGDGEVSAKDIESVNKHFSALDTTKALAPGNAPPLWIDFPTDTIVIDPSKPAPLNITANIMLGEWDRPVLGLYGLAFALRYADYVNHDPSLVFSDELFDYNTTLSLKRDIHSRRQYDIALSKNDQQSVSGYGNLGILNLQTDFVIIVDITSRSSSKVIPFALPIAGVRAIGPDGQPMNLNGQNIQDTVWIKLLEKISSTVEANLSELTAVYPNPAQDHAAVYTADLNVERIEIRNMLGNLVQNVPYGHHSLTRFDVSALAAGVYTLSIITDKGVAEEQLVVQR